MEDGGWRMAPPTLARRDLPSSILDFVVQNSSPAGNQRADVSAAAFLGLAAFGSGRSGFVATVIFVATSSVISTAGSMVSSKPSFLGTTMLRPRAAATSRSTGLACSRN